MGTIESLSERLEALEHVGVDNEYLGVRGGTLRVGLLVAWLRLGTGSTPRGGRVYLCVGECGLFDRRHQSGQCQRRGE